MFSKLPKIYVSNSSKYGGDLILIYHRMFPWPFAKAFATQGLPEDFGAPCGSLGSLSKESEAQAAALRELTQETWISECCVGYCIAACCAPLFLFGRLWEGFRRLVQLCGPQNVTTQMHINKN